MGVSDVSPNGAVRLRRLYLASANRWSHSQVGRPNIRPVALKGQEFAPILPVKDYKPITAKANSS
jgi:hypothetical protein